MTKIIKLVLAAFLIVVTAAQDQIIDPAELEEIVKGLLKCPNYAFAGITVSIVHGNRTQLWTHGVLDTKTNRPVNTDTKFGIGSITKGFTAALLIQQLENVGLTTNATARSIWGESFQMANENLTMNVNVQDLLSHRTGLAAYSGGYLMSKKIPREHMMQRLKDLPSVLPFRDSYNYNNFMFAVAGMLAQKLSGTDGATWESLLRNKVFTPLNMTSTTFAYNIKNWNDNVAMTHYLKDGELIPTEPDITAKSIYTTGPTGAIFTTAEDMTKWLRLFLNKGQAGVISEKTVTTMMTPHNIIPFNKDSWMPMNYTYDGTGLGWAQATYRGHRWYWHGGFINNYCSRASWLPDDNVGVFLSLNGGSYVPGREMVQALHFWIFEKVLGYQPSMLNSSNICNPAYTTSQRKPENMKHIHVQKQKTLLKNNMAQLKKGYHLEGVYSNAFLGSALIKRRLNKLQFVYGRYGKANLVPTEHRKVYNLDFIDELWYLTGSDEVKFVGGKNFYNIQFSGNDTHANEFTMAMFDYMLPPTFTRIS